MAGKTCWPLLVVSLLLASPALTRDAVAWPGSTVRCLTYEDKTIGLWQTLCDNGTRAVSTYNRTLARWETIVMAPPGKTCEGQLNPRTQEVEVRCR